MLIVKSVFNTGSLRRKSSWNFNILLLRTSCNDNDAVIEFGVKCQWDIALVIVDCIMLINIL